MQRHGNRRLSAYLDARVAGKRKRHEQGGQPNESMSGRARRNHRSLRTYGNGLRGGSDPWCRPGTFARLGLECLPAWAAHLGLPDRRYIDRIRRGRVNVTRDLQPVVTDKILAEDRPHFRQMDAHA
jgi:hypothetical protein